MMKSPVLRWPNKDPADRVDYSLDWRPMLALGDPIPDTITDVAWTVPAGLTQTNAYEVSGVTTIWLTGGTPGIDYTLTCRITTTNNRIHERDVRLAVQDL